MVVTRAVTHFEMSALNAAALKNAVGVHMSMQLMLNPNTEKKRDPKLLENHKFMEQAIEQEDKEVDVGRTCNHGRHPSRVPL
jgi:hypothetical protein